MILFFTGTGNSRYIARRIADSLGDELLNMNERIKAWDTSEISADGRLVFVVPTYGWRIPRIVEKWIDETPFSGSFKVWFVMDCGGEIGDADKYIRQLCSRKSFDYMGVKQIVMPENYVAMFGVPNDEQAARIIEKAQPDIADASETIKAEKKFAQPRRNAYDKLMSDIVNPVFYKLFVKADAFTANDKCIGCGKCAKMCPLNNIKLKTVNRSGARIALTVWRASASARRKPLNTAKRVSVNRDIILIKSKGSMTQSHTSCFYFLFPSAIIRAPTAAVAAVPAHMPYFSFSLSSASFMYRIIETGVFLNRSKYVTVFVLYSNGLALSSSKIRTPRILLP